jgi:hypothetical protein
MLKEFKNFTQSPFAPSRKEDCCDGFPYGQPNRGGCSRRQHGRVLLGGGKR